MKVWSNFFHMNLKINEQDNIDLKKVLQRIKNASIDDGKALTDLTPMFIEDSGRYQ